MSARSNEESDVIAEGSGFSCSTDGSGGGCSIKRNLITALYYSVVLLGVGAVLLSVFG